MKITLHVFADNRDRLGFKELEPQLEAGLAIRGLLELLVMRSPVLGRAIFEPSGDLKVHVIILVNGRNLEFLDRGTRAWRRVIR